MSTKCVLCVDDEPQVVNSISRLLKLAGYTVYSTSLESAAFELIELGSPEAILLDLSMPSISGFEILNKLKKSGFSESHPVIVVSGHDDKDTRDRARALGAVDFISKPFEPSILLKVLKKHIGESMGLES